MGRRIVFVDETVFSYKTIQTRAYSKMNQNVCYPHSSIKHKPAFFKTAVSNECGLEGYVYSETPINSQKFCQILSHLAFEFLYLTVFGAKINRFNYKPEKAPMLNPIEEVFSIVKTKYRQLKLDSQINQDSQTLQQLVEQSIDKVYDRSIKSICKDGLKKWQSSSLSEALSLTK